MSVSQGHGVSAFPGAGGINVVPNVLTAARYCPIIYTGTAMTTVSAASQLALYVPFRFANTTTFEAMSFEITTGAVGTALVGIYSDKNGRPDQLLYSGTIADTNVTAVVTSTQTMTFIGGVRYWYVICCSATCTVRAAAVASNMITMGSVAAAGNTTHYNGYTVASITSLAQTAPTMTTLVTTAGIRAAMFFHF